MPASNLTCAQHDETISGVAQANSNKAEVAKATPENVKVFPDQLTLKVFGVVEFQCTCQTTTLEIFAGLSGKST